MPTIQSKHWCFTLNNYTADEVQELEALVEERPGIVYIVIGVEESEEGTPHLQGFVSFEKRTANTKVKKILGRRCHIERAKGSPQQASDYCKKDGKFVESGVCPKGQGSRSDLRDIAKKIKEGTSMRKLAEEHLRPRS